MYSPLAKIPKYWYNTILGHITPFLSPASRNEEWGLLNLLSSVCPSVHLKSCATWLFVFFCLKVGYFDLVKNILKTMGHVSNCSPCIFIKAGDSRATRTLVCDINFTLQWFLPLVLAFHGLSDPATILTALSTILDPLS